VKTISIFCSVILLSHAQLEYVMTMWYHEMSINEFCLAA